MLGEQPGYGLGIVVRETDHGRTRQSGPRIEAAMREGVDQHEIAGSGERAEHADVGEVARAEQACRLAALGRRQPVLQRGMKRVVAGHEPRGAGAGAPAFRCGDGRSLDAGIGGEAEIIVAGKRDQPPAVPDHLGEGAAVGLDERAAQRPRVERLELGGGIGVERAHPALSGAGAGKMQKLRR